MKTSEIDGTIERAKNAGLWLLADKPVTSTTVAECEQRMGLSFPDGYKHFLLYYGNAVLPGIEILWLIDRELGSSSHLNTLRLSSEYHATENLPRSFVVVRVLSDGCLACLDLSKTETTQAQVVLWDIYERADRQVQSPSVLADSFEEYLLRSIEEARGYS